MSTDQNCPRTFRNYNLKKKWPRVFKAPQARRLANRLPRWVAIQLPTSPMPIKRASNGRTMHTELGQCITRASRACMRVFSSDSRFYASHMHSACVTTRVYIIGKVQVRRRNSRTRTSYSVPAQSTSIIEPTQRNEQQRVPDSCLESALKRTSLLQFRDASPALRLCL